MCWGSRKEVNMELWNIKRKERMLRKKKKIVKVIYLTMNYEYCLFLILGGLGKRRPGLIQP